MTFLAFEVTTAESMNMISAHAGGTFGMLSKKMSKLGKSLLRQN